MPVMVIQEAPQSSLTRPTVSGWFINSIGQVIVRANAGPPGTYLWRNLPTNLTRGEATRGGLDIEKAEAKALLADGIERPAPVQEVSWQHGPSRR